MKKFLLVCLAAAALPAFAAEWKIELESGTSPTGGASVKERAEASGGKTVVLTARPRKAAPDLAPDWRVTVNAPEAGRYRASLMCYTASSSSDSVFRSLNGGPERQFSPGIHPDGKLVIFGFLELKKGENTLDFRTREMGFEMDFLLLEPAAAKKTAKQAAPAGGPYVSPGDLEAAKFRYDGKKALAELRPEAHPCVFFTPENIAEARARLKTSPELQTLLKTARANAAPFLGKSDAELRAMVPPAGADIVYGLGLDIDPHGVKVTWNGWKDPFRVTGKDGIVYPNKDHPDTADVGFAGKDSKRFHPLARAYGAAFASLSGTILPALADLYSLTGEKKYAHIAAVLMDAAAPAYAANRCGPLDYPVSPRDGDRGGRLTGAYYMASRRLMKVVDVFDRILPSGELMKPSLAAPGRTMFDNIAENVLWNGAVYCLGHALDDPMRLNGYADFLRAPVAVGLLLDRQDLARFVMDPVRGLPSLLESNLGRDGFYCESSHMYSFHTMSLYTDHADFAESGLRRGWEGFHSFYDDPLFFRYLFRCFDRLEVGGHLPTTGDNGSAPDRRYFPPAKRTPVSGIAGVPQQIEYAWRILAGASDPALKRKAAELLRNSYGKAPVVMPNNRAILFRIGEQELKMIAEAKLDPNYFETGSDFFGGKGLAMLRGGRGNDRHGAQLMLGPQLNHGQFEALSWLFFNDGVDWSMDPGYFNTHFRFSWVTRSVAHQQMVADERNVETANGGAHLAAWKSGGPVQFALGEQPGAYNGMERFDRLIAQVDAPDGRLDYWLDIGVAAGGKVRDDSFHTVMTKVEFSEPFTPTGQYAIGNDAAKGMVFRNDYRLSGFPKKPFYWGLPGDGYPLLTEPASLKTDRTLRGVYTEAGFPEIAARKRTITVDFPAEAGVEYLRAQSPKAYRTVSVPYLLRRDRKPEGSVFAKVIRFDGSSVEKAETVAAEGLSRAYLVTRKDGRDLWIRGPLAVPKFGVATDGAVTLVRFDKTGKAVYLCASGATAVTVAGKRFDARAAATGKIVGIDGKTLTVELDRPAVGELLLARGSGLPATWKIAKIDGNKIELDTAEFFTTFSVLTPEPGNPGWYEFCPNQGCLRTLDRVGLALVKGRALYANGQWLGSIADARRDGLKLFVKLDAVKPVPAETRVRVAETKPGDGVVIPGNFEWRAE